jgi:putative ABC transport system permease protein
MHRLRSFISRCIATLRPRRAATDEDLSTELKSHVQFLTEENIRRGMNEADARAAANREFGGVEQTKEKYREQRGWSAMSALWRDVRYGSRLLTKTPALSAVIILILAVGIGSGTAIYSLIDACLLRSNTYPVVDRWDVIRAYLPSQKIYSNYLSTPEILEVKQLTDIFDDVGAVHGDGFTLSAGEFPERIGGTHVSANAITMTQVAPFMGRTFLPEEDHPGGPLVALLSYELWHRKFSEDRNILGKPIRLSDVTYTVVGVMPPHFDFWGGQVWIPLQLDLADQNRSDRRNWIVGVLRKDVTEKQANARLRALSMQLAERYGTAMPEYRDWSLAVWNINEAVIGGVRPALLTLAGAVAFLVLIASANVAILLMARSTARMREIAVRMALGARPRQIVRQLLTESLLIAIIAAIAGVCIAAATLPLLVHMIPLEWLTTFPELIRVNIRALAVACGIAATVGVLFGLAPALQLARQDFVESLKEGGSKIGGDRRGRSARSSLVVAEIAMSLVVLAACALMLQSYRHLQGIDLGFRPDHMLSFEISLPQVHYARRDQIAGFFQRAVASIQSLPHVDAAGVVSGQPMTDRTVDLASRDFSIEGRPTQDAHANENANFRIVTPGYFRTMGMRLLQGRALSEQDGVNAPPTTVINESMSHTYWPNGDALGKQIRLGRVYGRREMYAQADAPEVVLTIVGIVADVKQTRVIEQPARPEIYIPLAQQTDPSRDMAFVVRSSIDPTQLVTSIRGALATIDPQEPVSDVDTMDQIVVDAFGPKRLTLFLLAFLAAVVLVLSSVGLYAALAYSVGQRRHEIGIRVALGADGRDISRMVVAHGARLALLGVALGLGASLLLTRLMKDLLYGVSAGDPLTLAGTALLLTAVALIACFVPARRATQIDPLVALRYE